MKYTKTQAPAQSGYTTWLSHLKTS